VKTAVDSSVLLDVLAADAQFGEKSRAALRSAYDAGALLACEVVWAEVRANFVHDEPFEEAMRALGITYNPISALAARAAGRLWRERHRKSVRKRVVADFLIGAHARLQADALLSRDRGFFRRYFADLRVINPASS